MIPHPRPRRDDVRVSSSGGDSDGESSPRFEFDPVEVFDRRASARRVRHAREREPATDARLPVRHHPNVLRDAVRREHHPKIVVAQRRRKVRDVQFRREIFGLERASRATIRPVP